jgi:hypothetical protein
LSSFNINMRIATLLLALKAAQAAQLFNFTSYVDIENSQLRPNGHLLLTTFHEASLYTLDPHAHTPTAELVATFPGATALTGIAPIGNEQYAVVGGVRGSYHYENETLYSIDLNTNTTKTITRLPNASMLNGMASMPSQPHIVLIADSRLGCIFRVDTRTGISTIAIQNDALAPPANASVPIGINGLQVVGGNVFFTNTARNIFARIPVSGDGEKFGSMRVIARLDSVGSTWDDLAIDADGTAYVAQSPQSIAKIAPDGSQSIVAGSDGLGIVGPTSVQLARGGWAYVTTRGGEEGGFTYSGQVVAVKI